MAILNKRHSFVCAGLVLSSTLVGITASAEALTNSNGISGGVQEAWVARYHRPGPGDDRVRAMAVDPDGNVYVTGGRSGGGDYSEYTTLKYDPNGETLWLANYHDLVNAGDEAVALALDANGSVYVTGTICTEWRIVIGCVHWAYATIKYNSQGQLLWIARYHYSIGSGDSFATAIAIDAEGNAYVTGRSFSDDIGSNYATIKYDTDGRQIWVTRHLGESWARPHIAVDAQGNAYVSAPFNQDYATIKYDSEGNEVWVSRYHRPGTVEFNRPTGFAVDGEGNVYVTGNSGGGFNSTVKYGPDGKELWVALYEANGTASALAVDAERNVYVAGSSVVSGRSNYATIKYDSEGNEAWVAGYHGPGDGSDFGDFVVLDKQGNAYVTGSSSGTSGGSDFATIKYDLNGNEVWIARYGGPGNGYDRPMALAVDPKGNVYATGWSQGLDHVDDYATVKYTQ